MVFNVHQLSNTTNVVSSLDEHSSSVFEFNNFVDLISLKVQLNGIVLLDLWVGVADGSTVVSHNIRNFVLAETLALHFAQFETCLLSVNSNGLEASLDVVQNAEVFAGFWDVDNIHKAKWEPRISPDFVVNSDIAFSFIIGVSMTADFNRVLGRERVLKSVLEQYCQRDALTQLVRAC
jgi:hypothetical protein